jgi:hypothetical protein
VRGRSGHAQRPIEAPHEHRELATRFRSGPKLEFHDVLRVFPRILGQAGLLAPDRRSPRPSNPEGP